ncbi:MAG: Valine--tRNA ligase [Mycoplasmataceae bacterium]|nr:MAG: Valine--tRNA ligase [Mycoplasmataceae bacterium]
MTFSDKYDFRLTEKKTSSDYWKKIAKKSSIDFVETLLLPPPNITGKLHLGHAFESVVQDFLVRFSYLNKKPIYWIAGIDHAGISTQSKIESLKIIELNDDQKKRDYTLEIWYPETRKNFYQQWDNLGLLIDSERASFTLDPIIQKQVREAFVKLYRDGLIHRGPKIVNWDIKLKSVISDIEVEHKQEQSKLYYLKYHLENSNDYLLVATSRPETIFADVALLVNPSDKRYKIYLGKKAKHPWTNKIIPILGDEAVKIDFGSGVLKCTPGHDFTDYKLGKKYQLSIISCCDEKGVLNELAGKWQGREISSIRQEFIEELTEKGICVKVEDYETNLAYSSKSGTIIEPLLSRQWFLDLPTLIKKTEAKQPNFLNKIKFTTDQFQKKLEDWCNKTHEWCISRQLWWGHRIPSWYHKETGEVFVGEELNKCSLSCQKNSKEKFSGTNYYIHEENCSSLEWEPETDVLDTWFSSGLWPLVALAKENEKFPSIKSNLYPITKLITGYDILFFWVLKMILLGIYFTDKVPFKEVLVHGLIRDKNGKKMSKSLGNGVEPEELIKKYGTDSLRIFLLENNSWGSDLVYNEEKVIGGWRFCQKLWSINNLIKSKISANELKKINFEELDLSQLL